ncbi:hypothetical protein [Breoghania sp.]|uniref:hypothetical protein n=1 Tax=Breoghania sp. TaxID=2065378 RepID=UPI002638EB64|nr:hypothetical protein [Breoghania sp.]MDJ0930451.1 hypothetical protein [Breoghania sp.]
MIWHMDPETTSEMPFDASSGTSDEDDASWMDEVDASNADDTDEMENALSEEQDEEGGSEDDGKFDDDPNWAFAGADEEEADQALEKRDANDDWESEIGLKDASSSEDDEEGESDEEAVEDIEHAAAAGRKRRGRKKASRAAARYWVSPQMRAVLGFALFAGSIVLSITMITLREPIVRASPNLADLYAAVGLDVNLRDLGFRDLRTFREYEKGCADADRRRHGGKHPQYVRTCPGDPAGAEKQRFPGDLRLDGRAAPASSACGANLAFQHKIGLTARCCG